MANREFIRSRIFPKALPLGEYKSYSLFAKIVRFSANGIQITKAGTNSKFWIDISRYQTEHKEPLSSNFKEGEEVELTISFNSYLNQFEEYTLKLHLIDIVKADPVETYPYEFKEQEFTFDGFLLEAKKTDLSNVYVLKIVRFSDNEEEKEIYHIRYFSPEKEPVSGNYEVVFSLKNTPNIINPKGEVFSLKEKYQKDNEVRTTKVFVPCLEIRGLYPQSRT